MDSGFKETVELATAIIGLIAAIAPLFKKIFNCMAGAIQKLTKSAIRLFFEVVVNELLKRIFINNPRYKKTQISKTSVFSSNFC